MCWRGPWPIEPDSTYSGGAVRYRNQLQDSRALLNATGQPGAAGGKNLMHKASKDMGFIDL